MGILPPRKEMERAYTKSDTAYDGVFYLGVRTTGIFCRPSCGARKPHPANVAFFATPREAVFAGYRPCKRCNPLATIGHAPEWIQRLLAMVDGSPERKISDRDIRTFGVDPARVRRFFQKQYGMSFHAYSRGRRLGRALEQIRNGERLDDVTLGHGYESHSGFREAFVRTFGMPPGRAHTTASIVVTWIDSPLGPLIAGATESHLVILEFTDRRMLETQFVTLRKIFRRPVVPGENAVLKKLKRELVAYFAGNLKRFTVPLEFPGSDFQRRVWEGLLTIPYGKTESYEGLARRLGMPLAQRAVGHANGLNRIAIVIPCHRVVNKNGKLGGYGGGLWRKTRLLELEKASATTRAQRREV